MNPADTYLFKIIGKSNWLLFTYLIDPPESPSLKEVLLSECPGGEEN